MSEKKSFVLRMDKSTYDALERWAADEFRSINGQIEYLLHQELRKAGRLKAGAGSNPQKANEKKNGNKQ
ncbi:MAG: Arc family DNA-binding protein [Chitinophagaceae bacterium]|nr:Arc family DNA-binding protein [Chitinophagaceae bacterium]MCZ2396176.1 Arc family DNA-binding protein [Chitinophagales bacterium]